MHPACIAAGKGSADIITYLQNELEKYDHIKKSYIIDSIDENGFTSVICKLKNPNLDNKSNSITKTFRIHLSNALADFIMNKYEEALISKIILSNYCYFNHEERQEVAERALKIVRNEDKSFINSIYRIRRRNLIIKKLIDFLDSSDNLILDGFVTFRLKDYVVDLEEIVDKAVDNYLMDKEYKEFIKLLTYFVEIQEPRYKEVHIWTNQGKYSITDHNKQDITDECIEEFNHEKLIGRINQDDLLISSLISIAPLKIVIHDQESFRNAELLNTIKSVFCNRVIIEGNK